MLGDAVDVGVLAGGGLLVEGGEGDRGDNDFGAPPHGDDQLNFGLATCGYAACPLVWRVYQRGNPRFETTWWVYRAVFLFSNVLLREI